MGPTHKTLHRKIAVAQGGLGQRGAAGGINRGQRFEPSDLRGQRLGVLRRTGEASEENQSSSPGDRWPERQAAGSRIFARPPPGPRAVLHRRDLVGHDFISAPFLAVRPGDHQLFRRQPAQGGELPLPERLALDFEKRFVAPHARRFSARQENCAAAHRQAVFSAAGCRILSCASPTLIRPSVRMRARNPPRPARNFSAPGAKAVFIQWHGAQCAVPRNCTP